MVLGIGCDLVEVKRFEKWLDSKDLQKRYFTKSELDYIENVHSQVAKERLAGMFSLKEAFIKSVMCTVVLTDIIVERNGQGAPRLRLERSAEKALKKQGATYTLATLSHEKEYAMGMVVIGC